MQPARWKSVGLPVRYRFHNVLVNYTRKGNALVLLERSQASTTKGQPVRWQRLAFLTLRNTTEKARVPKPMLANGP